MAASLERKMLPVTVLSGFLGAGKTTLLKKILTSADADRKDFKIAVLVNDMGEINIDANEIKSTKLIQEEAQMVELHNGCICCTLRGDLLKTVKSLSEEGTFDYLVIESTGISEPLPVAQTFVMDVDGATLRPANDPHDHVHGNDQGFKSLSHFAKLDTMVTVIDTINIFEVLGSISTLAEKNLTGMVGNTGLNDDQENKKPAAGKQQQEQQQKKQPEVVDERSIAQLMLDQIEFANVVILSKAPLVKEPAAINEVSALVQRLNPGAKVIVPQELHFADLSLDTVINTKMFDMEKAQKSAGWITELQKQMTGEGHTPETEEYGISSVLFKCHTRPFHPKRLRDILAGFGNYSSSVAAAANATKDDRKNGKDDDDEEKEDVVTVKKETHAKSGPFNGVVRAKGRLWIASSCSYPVNLQISGRHLGLAPTQPFLHAVMESEWPNENWNNFEHFEEFKGEGIWFDHTGYGDSMSEAVFIGVNLDKEKITEELQKALLTDKELKGGKKAWKKLEDPFFGGQFFHVRPEEQSVAFLKQVIRRKK